MLYELINWEIVERFSLEDLERCKEKIEEIIKKKERAGKESKKSEYFKFSFKAKSDKRKAFPYVAKLYWNEEKNCIERKFMKMSSHPVSTYVVEVQGHFYAKNGEVVEMQTGGDGKNKFRETFIVKNGKLAPMKGSKSELEQYLQDRKSP